MAPDFEAVLGRLRGSTCAGHAWQRHASIDNRKDFAQQVKSLPFTGHPVPLLRFAAGLATSKPDRARSDGLATPAILRVVGAA